MMDWKILKVGLLLQVVWEAGFALEQSEKVSSQKGGDHKGWAIGPSVVALFMTEKN